MVAPELVLDALTKSFGSVAALRACSLTVGAGECVAILGTSGCGKTTLLRTVAGLEALESGRLWFGTREMSRVPTPERDVGFVFQSDALFPRATAYENIAFGLRARHVPRRELAERVRTSAARVRATAFLERRAAALSGGERQRVALARALAVEPAVVLLDEPLSRLDTPLRAELRKELANLIRERTATMLYVTHDQDEALALGDRIAVMRDGAVVQVGPARELFERPRDVFVATALGTPAIALVPARSVYPDAASKDRCGLRASAVRLCDGGGFPGIVRSVEDFLDVAYVEIECSFGTLVARVLDRRPVIGERVVLAIDLTQALFFDSAGTRRVTPVLA